VQEHITQLDERIQRLQRENNELRKDINETVGKLETKEEEYCHLVDGSVKDLDSVRYPIRKNIYSSGDSRKNIIADEFFMISILLIDV